MSDWIDLDELSSTCNEFKVKGWIDPSRGIELMRDISSGKISMIARTYQDA